MEMAATAVVVMTAAVAMAAVEVATAVATMLAAVVLPAEATIMTLPPAAQVRASGVMASTFPETPTLDSSASCLALLPTLQSSILASTSKSTTTFPSMCRVAKSPRPSLPSPTRLWTTI